VNGDYRYQVFLVLDDMITTSKADQIQFNLKWRERTNDCWLNIIVSLFDVTSQTISFISNIFNGRGKDPFSIMAFSTIFTIFYCFVWHFLPQPRFFFKFFMTIITNGPVKPHVHHDWTLQAKDRPFHYKWSSGHHSG
jgi:hypothetical protein